MQLPPFAGRHGAFASCLCLLAALAAFGLSAGADSANSPPPGFASTVACSGRRTARFSWRGLTAFRLVEMVAHGRRAEAVRVLDWARSQKPVVDDELIGAAEADVPGRRDADTETWFARGLLARLLEIGTTFHDEGGLQGRVPSGREAACFDAWRRGSSWRRETGKRGRWRLA